MLEDTLAGEHCPTLRRVLSMILMATTFLSIFRVACRAAPRHTEVSFMDPGDPSESPVNRARIEFMCQPVWTWWSKLFTTVPILLSDQSSEQ